MHEAADSDRAVRVSRESLRASSGAGEGGRTRGQVPRKQGSRTMTSRCDICGTAGKVRVFPYDVDGARCDQCAACIKESKRMLSSADLSFPLEAWAYD